MKDGDWKYWMIREAVNADDRSFMPFVLLFNDMVDMTVPCGANRWGIYMSINLKLICTGTCIFYSNDFPLSHQGPGSLASAKTNRGSLSVENA